MVMRRYHDGSRSYAINEFPLVTDEAIEEYWIRKVERHRRVRQEIFEGYDAEELLKGGRSKVASSAHAGTTGSFKAEL